MIKDLRSLVIGMTASQVISVSGFLVIIDLGSLVINVVAFLVMSGNPVFSVFGSWVISEIGSLMINVLY